MDRTPSRNRIIIIRGRITSEPQLVPPALDKQHSTSGRIVLFKNGQFVGGRVSALAHTGDRRRR